MKVKRILFYALCFAAGFFVAVTAVKYYRAMKVIANEMPSVTLDSPSTK